MNIDLLPVIDFENQTDSKVGMRLDDSQRGVEFTAYKNMPDGHLRICTELLHFYEIVTNPNCVTEVLEKLKDDLSRPVHSD